MIAKTGGRAYNNAITNAITHNTATRMGKRKKQKKTKETDYERNIHAPVAQHHK